LRAGTAVLTVLAVTVLSAFALGCGGSAFQAASAGELGLAEDEGPGRDGAVIDPPAVDVIAPDGGAPEGSSSFLVESSAPSSDAGTVSDAAHPPADAGNPDSNSLPNCTLRGQALPSPSSITITASRSDFGTSPYGIENGNSWTPGATSSWLMLQFTNAQTIRGLALVLDSNGPDPQTETIAYLADGVTVATGTSPLQGSVGGGPAMFGGVTIDRAPTGPVHTIEITFTGTYNINVLSVTLLTEACP